MFQDFFMSTESSTFTKINLYADIKIDRLCCNNLRSALPFILFRMHDRRCRIHDHIRDYIDFKIH